MNRFLLAALLLSSFLAPQSSFAAGPLRVFIRSGPKSHGPGAHDHPSFLKDWVPLLNERGAKATGSEDFPTRDQLAQTDVLIIHRDGGGNFTPEHRALLDEFTQRGGGIVVIHAGCVADKPEGTDYYKQLIGGSWRRPVTKWLEGPMHLYFTDRENPITKDMSNFAMDDEIYYDMDLLPECRVLAAAYTPKPRDTGGKGNKEAQARAADAVKKGGVNIYDIQPQVWIYERNADVSSALPTYRAFTCIPGHYYRNFSRPVMRALILRGIAWAGKRENADELLKPGELGDNLRYVEGGPTRPEKAHEHLEVHPEFNISLIAAEPLINKPMNIDWDEKGRLWVCETPEYPNGRRELNVEPWKESGSWTKKYDRDPIDRISILTDTNGDGVMDKKHVFADKLELVTSFCFYKNGVIACAAPDIWYLEDTNGDEVADKRTKLYTGLGTHDTHAVINNLRWGLDGWVYATHGYSAGDVAPPGNTGVTPSTHTAGAAMLPTHIGSGVVRFKPDGSAIEQYSSRGGNTWGLDITWDGQVFFTQPTSGTVLFHVVLPEYVLAKGKIPGTNSWKGMIEHQKSFPLMSWPEQAYVQIDLVGEFTAAAGCAIYEGGAWPEKWNYSYFTTEPTLNIVHHQFVKKDGVSYRTEKEKGREETEFIRSRDLWFRPIEVRVGPDGALYVIDFYNQAVIHNDTRGPIHGPANAAVRPDRDHYFGRIWKVQHKEAKKLEVVKLERGNLESLTQVFLGNSSAHVKMQAWRLADEEASTSPEKRNLYWDLRKKNNFGRSMATEPHVIAIAIDAHVRQEDRARWLQKFAEAKDEWTRSAIVSAAIVTSKYERTNDYIAETLTHPSSAHLAEFVRAVLPSVVSVDSNKLIYACADSDSKADELKNIILYGMALQFNEAPVLTPSVIEALKKLLTNPNTAGAALTLVAKWDKGGALRDEIKAQIATLSAVLGDRSAALPARISAAKALISLGGSNAQTGVEALADPTTPDELRRALIAALDESGEAARLVAAFDTLSPQLQPTAFDAILKRPEATLALLASIRDGKLDPKDLGPGNIARLRTHPNKQVAKQANAMMDKLSPGSKAKNEVIARLIPEVEKPGDPAKGKTIFTAACAICHKLGDVGKDVAPPLVGMGAHGPGELIVHIVDPNREVDPSFWAWNITKKNGETLAGVITSENPASLNLRNQSGDFEIKKADIATRENTRRSLMPEGLEALGAENLRDVLAFVCNTADQKFRVIDLRDAYTADSRTGIFRSEDHKDETVTLHKFGHVTVNGVPFFIMDPERSPSGANIVALKGGGKGTVAESFPEKVEITTNATAASLHFLGGVGGWAWPFGGDKNKGLPAMTVRVEFADGDQEGIVLKNGEHFADYIGRTEAPLSENAGDFTRRGQLRYFALNLKKKAPLKKITLETSGNIVTPCTVAITAGAEKAADGSADTPARNSNKSGGAAKVNEAGKSARAPLGDAPKAGGPGDGPLVPATPPQWEAGKKKVLVIGGGSSHDFARFFGDTDVATLQAAGFSVHYTEDRDQAAAELGNADVAVISVNRKFFDTTAYRKALMDFAGAGKGIVMLHPGTWYGYPQWPELNAQIVGGGARGHDKIHPFEVKALRPDHPVMEGVPASFTIEDELYYVNAEPDNIPEGTANIDVLAKTSPSDKFQKPHPSIWITRHPRTRIVGIAPGHDQRTHDHPAFKRVLANAVSWAAGDH